MFEVWNANRIEFVCTHVDQRGRTKRICMANFHTSPAKANSLAMKPKIVSNSQMPALDIYKRSLLSDLITMTSKSYTISLEPQGLTTDFDHQRLLLKVSILRSAFEL